MDRSLSLLSILLIGLLVNCDGRASRPAPPAPAGTDKPAVPADPSGAPDPYVGVVPSQDRALHIGTYPLKADGVVDGDTLKVVGIKKSLRLLSLDTEEVMYPSHRAARHTALMRRDFAAYARKMAEGQTLPAKYPTPMGETASRWAKAFFPPGASLLLERDVAGSGADRYGRELCLVWHEKDGRQRLYNLEAIRAGMSPYFVKYGRSRRFDAAFRAAQAEARAAQRGIWDPAAAHYPDYPERLAWWDRRAAALAKVSDADTGKAALVDLSHADAIRTLSGRIGQRVSVVGVIDDHDPDAVRIHARGATLRIGGRRYIEVELIGAGVVAAVRPRSLFGEMVRVTGVLDRKGGVLRGTLRFMRIPVNEPAQIGPAHLMGAGPGN